MHIGWKIFVRISVILLYLVFFFGVYLGLYVYFGNTTTVQDSREYNEKNRPEYFPVLIWEQGSDGSRKPLLRSLAKTDYLGLSSTENQSWHLYKQVEGEAGALHPLRSSRGVKYSVDRHSDHRLQTVITVTEDNNQRISTYTYEIKGNMVYPRSYILSSSFGHNFSPIPFLMMITGCLIYLAEKFVVNRLLKSSSVPQDTGA